MGDKMKRRTILAIILLATLLRALAQTPGSGKPATSYVIASPNTRESLTDQDARASLTSYEQLNAIAVADRVACSLARSRRPVGLSNAIGVYDTSAENSFIVKTSLPLLDTEYLAALLGRYSHQEFVLLFVADTDRNNNDRLWIIRTPQPLDKAIAAARRLHLTPLTARETRSGVELWIADIGNKSAPKLTALADELKATLEVHQGRAELIGDQDRMKAQKLFEKSLRTLEKPRKQRLSVYLWTRRWHDAITRTCSAEIPQ
jgi:hypothetical protein